MLDFDTGSWKLVTFSQTEILWSGRDRLPQDPGGQEMRRGSFQFRVQAGWGLFEMENAVYGAEALNRRSRVPQELLEEKV